MIVSNPHPFALQVYIFAAFYIISSSRVQAVLPFFFWFHFFFPVCSLCFNPAPQFIINLQQLKKSKHHTCLQPCHSACFAFVFACVRVFA